MEMTEYRGDVSKNPKKRKKDCPLRIRSLNQHVTQRAEKCQRLRGWLALAVASVTILPNPVLSTNRGLSTNENRKHGNTARPVVTEATHYQRIQVLRILAESHPTERWFGPSYWSWRARGHTLQTHLVTGLCQLGHLLRAALLPGGQPAGQNALVTWTGGI